MSVLVKGELGYKIVLGFPYPIIRDRRTLLRCRKSYRINLAKPPSMLSITGGDFTIF